MRQILVLVMVAGLAIGAAEAARGAVPVLLRTPGAQGIELLGGNGRAVVGRRGTLLLTINSGRLRIVDLPGAGRPNLSPQCEQRAHRVSATTVEITGRSIRCRIWSGDDGGPWQAIMRGRGISASGIVKGSLTLDGANTGAVGIYRIGGGQWNRWPRRVHTYELNRK